jgi:serine/threonine-protein kinase
MMPFNKQFDEELLLTNGYQIIKLIDDTGGMGNVYLGIELVSKLLVAIKCLKNARLSNKPDPRAVARFRREADFLKNLVHPYIVKLRELIEGETDYLVMEYVNGGNLRSLLRKLSIREAVEIAIAIADALAYAHDCGIIHRDLKPENVLITADGTVRLTDFGVAYSDRLDRLTSPGLVVGTAPYLPPEVWDGEVEPSPQIDIYALGTMLFEMVAGTHPFKTVGAALLQIYPDLGALRPDAPPELVELIYQMIDANLDVRPKSAHDIGAKLAAILQHLPEEDNLPLTTVSESDDCGYTTQLMTVLAS